MCETTLNSGDIGVTVQDCEKIAVILEKDSREQPKNKGSCINVYDVRLTDPQCGYSWPKELEYLTPYLGVSIFQAGGFLSFGLEKRNC